MESELHDPSATVFLCCRGASELEKMLLGPAWCEPRGPPQARPGGGGEGAEQRNKPGPVSLMSQSSSEAKSGVASQDRSFPSGK